MVFNSTPVECNSNFIKRKNAVNDLNESRIFEPVLRRSENRVAVYKKSCLKCPIKTFTTTYGPTHFQSSTVQFKYMVPFCHSGKYKLLFK